MPADISTTITRTARRSRDHDRAGAERHRTFTGVAADPPYTLSLGPAIATPVQITITGPTGAVVVDTFGSPIQNSSFPTDGSTAPFQIPSNGTYTIKIDYLGNGVGATPMSLIG